MARTGEMGGGVVWLHFRDEKTGFQTGKEGCLASYFVNCKFVCLCKNATCTQTKSTDQSEAAYLLLIVA